MSKPFEILDLSRARAVYAVGDIHGMYSELEKKLHSIGFDPEQDHLISVGDLVDRGPESERALEFCDKDWFHWIKGNHEELLALVAHNAHNTSIKNGQLWFDTVMPSRRQAFADRINDAPVILEIITPSGKRCGFVHACYPSDDWKFAEMIAHRHTKLCLWDRLDVKNPKPHGIRGIDYVFHGHNPLADPRTVANVVWIDTGACFGGRLTVVKLP